MVEFDDRQHRLTLRLLYCGAPGAGLRSNLEQIRRVCGAVGEPAGESEYRPLPALQLCEDRVCLAVEMASAALGDSVSEPVSRALDVADAIVFVADRRRDRLRHNLVAWAALLERLRIAGRRLDDVTLVLQWNRTAEGEQQSVSALEAALQVGGRPAFEADASEGFGVGKCFNEAIRRAANRAWQVLELYRHVDRGAFASAVDGALANISARPRPSTPTPEATEEDPATVEQTELDERDDASSAEADDATPAARTDERAADPAEDKSLEAEEPPCAPDAPKPQAEPSALTTRPWLLWARELLERSQQFEQARRQARQALDQDVDDLRGVLQFLGRFTCLAERHRVEDPELDAALLQAPSILHTLRGWTSKLQTRIERNLQSVATELVELEEPLTEALTLCAGRLRQRGLDARWGALPVVRGSSAAYTVALAELLRFAARHFDGADCLRITCRSSSRGHSLRVEGPFAVDPSAVIDLAPAAETLQSQGARIRVVESSGKVARLYVRIPIRGRRTPVSLVTGREQFATAPVAPAAGDLVSPSAR